MQVEALAVKLTQKEGELIQEKFEVKKLASFLKQVLYTFLNLLMYFLENDFEKEFFNNSKEYKYHGNSCIFKFYNQAFRCECVS